MEEGGYGGRAWIGLNLLDDGNSPKWSDGTNVSYQKVVKKEFPKKEKCFMMYRFQSKYNISFGYYVFMMLLFLRYMYTYIHFIHSILGGWRPEHCALHYPPICKIKDGATPTAVPPPTTLPPRTGYCPSGWIQFGLYFLSELNLSM